jgi:hypothetical protein
MEGTHHDSFSVFIKVTESYSTQKISHTLWASFKDFGARPQGLFYPSIDKPQGSFNPSIDKLHEINIEQHRFISFQFDQNHYLY